MIIDKTHSKTDLIELINNINLKVTFSHQDNKKDIQDKIIKLLKNKKLKIDENYYGINNRQDLITYLKKKNPKKVLNIKEKANVMKICKSVIQYAKNDFDLECCDYDSLKEIEDDMDYIKQFGDIPSVRRACRLINEDVKFGGKKFTPLISPQVQKDLEEKYLIKKVYPYKLTIRYSTPEDPVILVFD
jgi:hypothetical protein